MPHSETIELARALITKASVTPLDAGCQPLLAERLSAIGFQCEPMNFEDVSNLWATRGGAKPLLVFAGHTDVVPTGPLQQWRIPPFAGEVRDGMLHGRGAADMKGSVAAFVTACERFVEKYPRHQGAIGLLITGDEEGPARWGTRAVMQELGNRGVNIDLCIVGEPTSTSVLGDMVKIGRRGSLNGKLTIKGTQGHVAYPHLANNPIHIALPALSDLTVRQWDAGNAIFPPTCLQISNIQAGTGASNVIPGEIEVNFNFRYSTQTDADQLMRETTAIIEARGLEFDIEWENPGLGLPYQTQPGALVEAVSAGICEITGRTPELSATGGTSDGRFIAPTGAQVVEFGPLNATIHQIDEQVSVADLDLLSACYENILKRLLLERPERDVMNT